MLLFVELEGQTGQEQPAHCVLYSSGLAAAFALFSHFLPKRVFISGEHVENAAWLARSGVRRTNHLCHFLALIKAVGRHHW